MSSALPPGEHLGDRLSSMVDGELSPEELVAARVHLKDCGSCSRELAGVEAAHRLVHGLEPPKPPEAFLRGIVRRHRRTTLLLAAASVVVGVVAALVFALTSPREGVTPPVSRFERIHATSTPNPDPITEMAPVGLPTPTGP